LAHIILLCGKICSGKTYWAHRYQEQHNAVLLNVDEITTIFPDLGELHDPVTAKLRRYLLEKAKDICLAGVTVILDWGFWKKNDRDETDSFFSSVNCPVQWVYLEPEPETWNQYRLARKKEIRKGRSDVYDLDEGLLRKLESLFEAPDKEERKQRFQI